MKCEFDGVNLRFLLPENQYFYEPDFLKKNSFSSLNEFFFSSPEPPTIDFQHKINFTHALNRNLSILNSICLF